MLDMQDEMNRHVDEDWLERGREWYRAIWIECAELMDHYGGWKWWKHSTPDLDQAMLELVDIWHFGLSLELARGAARRDIATAIVTAWQAPPPALEFLVEVERLAGAALADRRFAVGSVANLVAACGRDFDDLYRTYVAKNVLNVFRQDHGYRSGTYAKTWGGREDNVVLAELLGSLDSDAADFRARVYAALEQAYAALEP
ncbi:MAG: dUTP diphosphatase [Gammaproteobacteria bacterium]|nr:dUTP diphosphatase [Gammaproteobacteria bacterium]